MISGKTESAVFFGTGPVAAKSLELLAKHTTIEAVVTKPKPPHHRGSVPVIETATSLGLPIVTAMNKQNLDEVMAEQIFSSRYAVLIDFGIIVSRNVIDTFELGIINSHFSLLPRLRGADPISWSIANGDNKTGVSLMLIDEGMDTGKLIAQKSFSLDKTETTPTLTDELITLSDTLLQSHVPRYLSGEITAHSQPHPDRATYSRKLTKSDGVINLDEPAELIEQKIRAFLDWPQSRTKIGAVEVIITKAHTSATPELLSLKCGDGNHLSVDTLKPLGKKEMPITAFLAGYKDRI